MTCVAVCYKMIGEGGNFAVESVATLHRNRWQLSSGIGGNFAVEYALGGGSLAPENVVQYLARRRPAGSTALWMVWQALLPRLTHAEDVRLVEWRIANLRGNGGNFIVGNEFSRLAAIWRREVVDKIPKVTQEAKEDCLRQGFARLAEVQRAQRRP